MTGTGCRVNGWLPWGRWMQGIPWPLSRHALTLREYLKFWRCLKTWGTVCCGYSVSGLGYLCTGAECHLAHSCTKEKKVCCFDLCKGSLASLLQAWKELQKAGAYDVAGHDRACVCAEMRAQVRAASATQFTPTNSDAAKSHLLNCRRTMLSKGRLQWMKDSIGRLWIT